METQTKAYLEIILGSMFSGKTSYLVEIYKQCVFCNIEVCVINSALDNRYGNSVLTTHDQVKIPCLSVKSLSNLFTDYSDAIQQCKVVLINEGQFFDDLYSVVFTLLEQGKKVYVCGLDGDFERKKFGQILDIIPLCDKVSKLTSLCSICKNGTPGIFSKRISGETIQTLVGVDNYLPVCRECYEK